jgi:hypothetical protein
MKFILAGICWYSYWLNIGWSSGSFAGFPDRIRQIEPGFKFTIPQHPFLIQVPEILDTGNDGIGRRMTQSTPAQFEGFAPFEKVVDILNHSVTVQDLL